MRRYGSLAANYSRSVADRIGGAMSPASLRRQVGQLLIAGFNGHQIPAELRELAREFGSAASFSRGTSREPEQVAELAFEASRLVPDLPLWVSVDQEGGRVARLKKPFTEWPPMATLGRGGNVDLAETPRARAGGRAQGRRHHARLRAGARHSYQSEESRHRRSCAGRQRRRRGPPRRGDHPRPPA